MTRGRGRAVLSGIDDRLRERLANLESRAGRRPRRRRRSPVALDELPGVTRTDGVLVIERRYSELSNRRAADRMMKSLAKASGAVLSRDDIDEPVRSLLADPAGALFIDTETTGLSGSVVFLLGAMRLDGDDLKLTQVLARDYREERALLEEWLSMLDSARALVSFNGRAFDVPLLRDRLGFHGMSASDEPPHVDLLHHARRRWGGTLPDCRLQTLERELCGRRRTGDIPGVEIPSVYHHFVRTGRADDMLAVLHHNALDILTLAEIALALAAPEDDPA